MWSLLKEFLKFSRQEKKWWLIPLIVVLLLLGAILIFTGQFRHRLGALSVFVNMPAPRKILGISAYYHDAAAALVV